MAQGWGSLRGRTGDYVWGNSHLSIITVSTSLSGSVGAVGLGQGVMGAEGTVLASPGPHQAPGALTTGFGGPHQGMGARRSEWAWAGRAEEPSPGLVPLPLLSSSCPQEMGFGGVWHTRGVPTQQSVLMSFSQAAETPQGRAGAANSAGREAEHTALLP